MPMLVAAAVTAGVVGVQVVGSMGSTHPPKSVITVRQAADVPPPAVVVGALGFGSLPTDMTTESVTADPLFVVNSNYASVVALVGGSKLGGYGSDDAVPAMSIRVT